MYKTKEAIKRMFCPKNVDFVIFMQFLAILRKISPTSQTQMGNLDKAGDGGWEGVTKNEHMLKLSKEIWHYLLNHNISITAEHLPSVLNTVTDRKSRKKKTYSTRWTLHPKVFQANSRLLGSLTIDLFASCLWHHPPQYIVWHPDPYSQWTDATIQNWNMGLSYAFPLSV